MAPPPLFFFCFFIYGAGNGGNFVKPNIALRHLWGGVMAYFLIWEGRGVFVKPNLVFKCF